MNDQKTSGFFKHISSKLSILLGGAVVLGAAPRIMAVPTPTSGELSSLSMSSAATVTLPPKLILKKTVNGSLKLIADHSSHSSHASHSSHSSHSSHASRAV